MPTELPAGTAVFRALHRPRPPFPAEVRLLSWLAPAVGPELTGQVAGADVVGACTCGCSSVQLSAVRAPLPVATVRRLSATGRTDHLAVSSSGRGPDGSPVDVVLHLTEGRLHELEVHDPGAGDGTPVDLAGVRDLGPPRVH
jgi:hypothetical protein